MWVGIALGLVGLVIACLPEMVGAHSTPGGIVASCAALMALTCATLVQSRNSGVGHWANLALQSTAAMPVIAVILSTVRPPRPPSDPAALAPVAWMILVVGIMATSLLYHLVRTVNVVGSPPCSSSYPLSLRSWTSSCAIITFPRPPSSE